MTVKRAYTEGYVSTSGIAVTKPVGTLFPLREATDVWQAQVEIPAGGVLCGGMSSSARARSEMPYPTRITELQSIAQQVSEETLPDLESPGLTVFRRHPESGALCISANQIRTMLQEAAKAVYEGKAEYYRLRSALRRNLRIEPTLIPILRPSSEGEWEPVVKPDGVLELPRLVRRPPYERSVLQQPEFVRGPIRLQFTLHAMRIGAGEVLTDEVLRFLLEYAGQFVKLGAHRGLEDTWHGEPGRFTVTAWEHRQIGSPSAPPLKARSKARKDESEG